MRSPVAPACTVRVSLILRLQPRDEQEPRIGRGIFGSRKPAGTPEPGSYWSLSGRTGGPRRAIRLLLVPVTEERPTLMSLLRVQGTQSQLWSTRLFNISHCFSFTQLCPLPTGVVLPFTEPLLSQVGICLFQMTPSFS